MVTDMVVALTCDLHLMQFMPVVFISTQVL